MLALGFLAFEPRARYPARAPCAKPRVPVREACGVNVELVLSHAANALHLPHVPLKTAACATANPKRWHARGRGFVHSAHTSMV
jgi:hypothetical protein